MTEKLKQIIDNAIPKTSGTFNEFLIVPTGEKNDGFWGENGFNKIVLLAKQIGEENFCILTDYSDSFHLFNIHSVNFDIPSDLNCVRLFLNEPIEINGGTSSIIGYAKENLKQNYKNRIKLISISCDSLEKACFESPETAFEKGWNHGTKNAINSIRECLEIQKEE